MSADAAGKLWIAEKVLAKTGLDPWDTNHDGWDQGYDEVVVYNLNRKSDSKFSGGVRVWFTPVFQVMAIVRGNRPDRADELADLIDQALQNQRDDSAPGAEPRYMVRQSEFESGLSYAITDEAGITYRHAGALYALKVRKEQAS